MSTDSRLIIILTSSLCGGLAIALVGVMLVYVRKSKIEEIESADEFMKRREMLRPSIIQRMLSLTRRQDNKQQDPISHAHETAVVVDFGTSRRPKETIDSQTGLVIPAAGTRSPSLYSFKTADDTNDSLYHSPPPVLSSSSTVDQYSLLLDGDPFAVREGARNMSTKRSLGLFAGDDDDEEDDDAKTIMSSGNTVIRTVHGPARRVDFSNHQRDAASECAA